MAKASTSRPLTTRERAARHRARLKARGLRRTQLLLPDLWAPDVQAELERGCREIALDPEFNAELEELFAFSDAAWADMPD